MALALWICLPLWLHAQSIPPERPRARPPSELAGWADWERAEELLERLEVPPAPPLSPAEALKTFRLAPGYRIELVAAEPMVVRPIFFEFDADGRIWVVEYQGYMRDLEGSGEGDPLCRIVVLEDVNEDGAADRSTVFLDNLVMPRSLAFVEGGVLVAEPPRLWFCRDANGDLRCDGRTQVGTYGQAGNPQHTANGLRFGIDNWLHSADSPKRHQFRDGKLVEQPTVHRGQFGVTFDDQGRFLTCYESSPLHADLIPAEYLLRNTNFYRAYQRAGRDRGAFGVAVNVALEAQEIFPIRVTPAITLGALELRPDGRLRTYTVVAGSCFYNGDQFPQDAYGNVFVPEAGGHLIGRLKLSRDLELKAARFYPAEQEFLASTDERFRPVNSRVGPDGALYIADLYHGIIEHVIFMVPYLERQIKERRLEDGADLGRIYRVVHEGHPVVRRRPELSGASLSALIGHLSHRNGWWRHTAQRLLVERRDPAAIPPLREAVRRAPDPLGRLHALWTLEGLGALDLKLLETALDDADESVRAAAIRLSEGRIGRDTAGPWLEKLERAAGDPSRSVRLQVLLSLGWVPGNRTRVERLMARMIDENEHDLFRAAAMTGVGGRELEFLQTLRRRKDWAAGTEHRRDMVRMLAQAVIDEAAANRVGRLLEEASREPPAAVWQRDAILDGIIAAIPRDARNVRPIHLDREPLLLGRLARAEDELTRRRAYRLLSLFGWPGSPNWRTRLDQIRPLTPEQRRLFELGKEQYALACLACHQPDGDGLPNVAPPLNGSEWVNGPAERLIRIVLQGLYGPIEVSGQAWNLHMPGWADNPALDDGKIAGILTYIRRSWENAADPIDESQVSAERRQTAGRKMAWTAAELLGTTLIEAPVIRPDTSGELQLPARLAVTHGRELAYRPTLDILAPWRHEHDVAEWQVEAPADGAYDVHVTLAADDASAGDRFVIETDNAQVTGTVPSTGGYNRFQERPVGPLNLRAGLNRVLMRPLGPLKRELADVRELRLVPPRIKP